MANAGHPLQVQLPAHRLFGTDSGPLIVGTSGQRSFIFGSNLLAVLWLGVLAGVQQRRILALAVVLVGLATVAQITAFVHGT